MEPQDTKDQEQQFAIDKPPASKGKNISGLLSNPRTRPVIVVCAIAMVIATLIVVAHIRGAANQLQSPEISGARMADTPRATTEEGQQATAQYQQLAKEDAARGASEAAKKGGSYIPAVDLSKPTAPLPLPAGATAQQTQPEFIPSVAPPPQGNRERVMSQIAVRVGEMQASAKAPTTHTSQMFASKDESGERGAQANAAARTTADQSLQAQALPLLRAGQMIYGSTDLEINTDYPAPITVTVASGPLKGSKLIGEPKLANDAVVLPFRSLSLADGSRTLGINAFAVSQDTDSNALATSVDKYYFQRYGALLSAALLRGYADAYTNSGATVVSNAVGTVTTYPPVDNKQLIAKAGGQVGNALAGAVAQNFNRPYTVKVARGTPIAIFFTEDVFLTNTATPQAPQPQAPAQPMGARTPMAAAPAPVQLPGATTGFSPTPTPAAGSNTNGLLPLPAGTVTQR